MSTGWCISACASLRSSTHGSLSREVNLSVKGSRVLWLLFGFSPWGALAWVERGEEKERWMFQLLPWGLAAVGTLLDQRSQVISWPSVHQVPTAPPPSFLQVSRLPNLPGSRGCPIPYGFSVPFASNSFSQLFSNYPMCGSISSRLSHWLVHLLRAASTRKPIAYGPPHSYLACNTEFILLH